MIEPTADERREVAAKLRELDGWETETLSDTWYVEQLSKIVGYSDTGSMTERLADLIEPTEETCHNACELKTASGIPINGPFTCSECGEHTETWCDIGFGWLRVHVVNNGSSGVSWRYSRYAADVGAGLGRGARRGRRSHTAR